VSAGADTNSTAPKIASSYIRSSNVDSGECESDEGTAKHLRKIVSLVWASKTRYQAQLVLIFVSRPVDCLLVYLSQSDEAQ
jgi:hypothetical protein